jgi:pectin methylesterase-like acyl-CoA thioesterase
MVATVTSHKTTTTGSGTSAMSPAVSGISAADVAGVVTAPILAPVVLSTTNGMVLTVGAGMEFATLGAALRNAVNGDTIAVKAGTYVNDFSVVQANVTIVAVGGMVNEVGTEPPPTAKASSPPTPASTSAASVLPAPAPATSTATSPASATKPAT